MTNKPLTVYKTFLFFVNDDDHPQYYILMNVQWPLFLFYCCWFLCTIFEVFTSQPFSCRTNPVWEESKKYKFHMRRLFFIILKNSSSTYILKHNQVFIHRHAIALWEWMTKKCQKLDLEKQMCVLSMNTKKRAKRYFVDMIMRFKSL